MIYPPYAVNCNYYRLHLLQMRPSTHFPTLLFKHVYVTQSFWTNQKQNTQVNAINAYKNAPLPCLEKFHWCEQLMLNNS